MSAALKLFTGETLPPEKNPRQWTVREAFENRVLKRLERMERSDATVAKWRIAIKYWEQIQPADTPVAHITSDQLTEFCDELLKLPKINTHTTANQKMMHIQSIIKACPDAFDTSVPVGTPLPEQSATRHRKIIPDASLNAMYSHCELATLSRDRRIPPPIIWRALLSLFVSIGCRRGEGCLMPRSAWNRSVEFPEFPEFPEHPDLEVDAESPHGWLVFHTPKTRARKKGLPLVLPVSGMLARHLEILDNYAPRRERLFPVGDHPTSWQGQLDRLQWGVRTTRGNRSVISDTYCFQDLRKTVNRRYRKHAGREVAKLFLGHQPRGVNASYYDDLTEDAVTATHTMSWPHAFTG
ncbi:hypothetical protein KOR42_39990 [Thalassoglobus neptunius]|uniref:Phage integrase family protein n=1 Tax=Thalassoglobus neptunius TaxID=1938619 RepID=A0A5C5WDT4_9PLAN|nr:hypothetical protein [Thalassoglobus neptunius]TWT48209.1 hypothetical protein KOR42_39990 [Thalassoglobus neptunius]